MRRKCGCRKLVRGMYVNVYEDPITCEKLEGRAKLIRPSELAVTYTPRWIVQFAGETAEYERAINPEKC